MENESIQRDFTINFAVSLDIQSGQEWPDPWGPTWGSDMLRALEWLAGVKLSKVIERGIEEHSRGIDAHVMSIVVREQE